MSKLQNTIKPPIENYGGWLRKLCNLFLILFQESVLFEHYMKFMWKLNNMKYLSALDARAHGSWLMAHGEWKSMNPGNYSQKPPLLHISPRVMSDKSLWRIHESMALSVMIITEWKHFSEKTTN